MKRHMKSVLFSLLLATFAGSGLTMSAQDSSICCPQPVQIAQPVCPQPVCPQPVVVAQPVCPQPTTVAVACGDPCVDMCELLDRIEDNADDLKKDFKDSLDCLTCDLDDSYYDSVKAFEKATDRLKKEYNDNCDENCGDVGGAQAAEVLSLANCISAYMDPCALCPEAVAAWNELKADLQTLAGQFCTTASFQQPVGLCPTCPVPVAQPVQFVQPVQTVQPVCCPNGNHDNNHNHNNNYK